LAEKWIKKYIKELHNSLKKDETIIFYLWKEASIYVKNLYNTTYVNKIKKCLKNIAYYIFFLNVLDKQEEIIHLKLLSLLKKIFKINIRYKEVIYKFITKSDKRK